MMEILQTATDARRLVKASRLFAEIPKLKPEKNVTMGTLPMEMDVHRFVKMKLPMVAEF